MKPEDIARIEEGALNYVLNHESYFLSKELIEKEAFINGCKAEHNYLTTQVVEAERKGHNQAIDTVVSMFDELFKIEPRATNIIQIATKVKSIYDEIQKLKK